MKIKPLFDRVVIRQGPAKERTAGGIVLPGSAQERPQIGFVIAVGDGAMENGKAGKMAVKVGDQVLFSKYSGSEYKLDDEVVTLLKQTDILGILEE